MIRKRAELYILRDGKVYVGVQGNRLDIPGGGVLKGESPLDGAVRETLEEIGIKVKNIKKLADKPASLKFPPGSKYSGQLIYSFRADFDGVNKEKWGVGPEGKLHPATVDIGKLIKYFEKRISKTKPHETWRIIFYNNTIEMLKLLK